jgi:5-methylcytosine-specific restriction endonuclease McrA
MGHTLILNADFLPLSIIPISSISWKDAIKVSFTGHARTIEYYDNWEVHSPSISMKVPAVMVSETYIKKKHSVRFSRQNLLIRDNFTCQYCEQKLSSMDLTVDHVIPRVKGGKTRWENIVCACYVCNSIKGHKSHMVPKRKPFKPDYHQLLENAKKMPLKIPSEKWIDYLGWDKSLLKIVKPDHFNLT